MTLSPRARGVRLAGAGWLLAACLGAGRGLSAPPAPAAPFDIGYGRETSYWTGDAAIDGLQQHLRPTLEANRKEFGGRSGPVKGFGAGTHYPQLWIRDSATLIPLSRYHYPRDFLSSWIVEHLAHQGEDGLLHDWVAVGEPERFRNDAPRVREVYRQPGLVMSADRNTSSADQESALVDAAFQVTGITGDARWLRQVVAGRSVISRLDRALAGLYRSRHARAEGLLTSAFTADWGDVSPAHGDQRVIYLDEQTPVVSGLYVNVYFVKAARALSALHRRLGDSASAARWDARAVAVGAAVEERLWQPARGFYRIHRPVLAPRGFRFPNDNDRFAMGGNALAALFGVASGAQSTRIFAVAEARQQKYGLPTVGGVLTPPYPTGFFKHPIMRDEFTYQNGGQWDWFAGRLLLAEFERGSARRAARQLGAIAQRALASGGLHEWSTREGVGKGSARYAGSAGALGGAVLGGLFGVDLPGDRYALTARLGDRPGRVRVYQPATDTYLAYEYRPDLAAKRITLRFGSNAKGNGRVRILLPPATKVAGVTLDGKPALRWRTMTVGDDSYVDLKTPSGPHVLELRTR